MKELVVTIVRSIHPGQWYPPEHTDRAQNRTTITASRGLQGVREAAQRDEGLRFTTLLHHVNVQLLRDSFFQLRKKAAPGSVDHRRRSMAGLIRIRLADV